MGANDRELDKQVAEWVLGHTVVGERKGTLKERTREGQVRPLRPYSSDMTAAWEVARRIKISLLPISDGNWFALAGNPGGWKHPGEFWEYLRKADFAAGGAAVSLSAVEAICLAAEARPEWCTRLWALIANAGPPGRMDWLLNRADNGGHRDIVTLPPDIRETVTQLIAAQQGRTLTDPEHARLANQIVEYLASRGVRAYAERRGAGPDYDVTLYVPFRRAALDRAQHFAVRMAKAFGDHWHPDMRLGFNTRNLLNELSGLPGSGGFNEAGARVDLTVQDLFGHRLFTPKGGHEARHVARAFRRSRGPQFALEGHRFAEGAEAGSMYARLLATEEISDTYPYSIRTWLRIQRNLLREADRLEATAPALSASLREQARHGLGATLFYAKLFAQMYDAATPVFDRIGSTPDLAARAVEETIHNYDRAIVLPTGERLLFKSDQIREWARGRGLTVRGDPSLDVTLVRRALREERDRIEQRGQALGRELETAVTN